MAVVLNFFTLGPIFKFNQLQWMDFSSLSIYGYVFAFLFPPHFFAALSFPLYLYFNQSDPPIQGQRYKAGKLRMSICLHLKYCYLKRATVVRWDQL